MPFKSQAQRRKFAQLLVEGKISNETYESMGFSKVDEFGTSWTLLLML